MAIRYAVATGNWSAVGTWDGGVSLPTVGDDVYANGFTVSIDQDITVAKISTEVCPTTSVGGGGFTRTVAGTGTLIITANMRAGTTPLFSYSNVKLYIIGDVTGGDVSGAYAINCASTAQLPSFNNVPEITGNLQAGTAQGCYALQGRTDRAYQPIIIGNITASAFCEAIFLTRIQNVITVGNITAVDSFSAIRAIPVENTYIYLTGIITSSSNIEAVQIVNCIHVISGKMVNVQGIMAIRLSSNSSKIYIDDASTFEWTFQEYPSLDDRTLYTADVLENPPAESDVRSGVVYGIGNAYTGTLAVPPATAVVKSVPVDNTVGTWSFDANLITRLENCATTNDTNIINSGISNINSNLISLSGLSSLTGMTSELENITDEIEIVNDGITEINTKLGSSQTPTNYKDRNRYKI